MQMSRPEQPSQIVGPILGEEDEQESAHDQHRSGQLHSFKVDLVQCHVQGCQIFQI